MCDVDEEAVVTAADAPSIYDIPKVLHREGLDAYVVRRLGLPFRDVDWTVWDDLLRRVHHPQEEVTIALVGKYIDLHDAYLSVAEALRAGGFAHEAKIQIRWIPSDECATHEGAPRHLHDVDAVCVPGGFGVRGLEGKIGALTYARTNRIPTLGLCLGLQCMVIEYARNVAGLEKADSTEFDPDSPEPVIATMEEQLAYVEGAGDLGGTMRLGPLPGPAQGRLDRARGLRRGPDRGAAPDRYEVNNAYRDSSRRPAWSSPGPPRTTTSSSSSSCRATSTPTTSPRRPTPSSGPARPARTRCSRAWSGPRSSARRSCGSRSTRPDCAASPSTSTTKESPRRYAALRGRGSPAE